MAFLSTVEIGSSPTICYDCWGSSQRIDNKTMRYVFEFNVLFRYYNTASFLGIGYGLDASVIIQSGSKTTESAKINIKNSRTEQWGPNQAYGQVLKNFKITVDVESTKANEAAQVILNITDNSHYYDDNESIGSATIGTVYSAALLYTHVTNPTNIKITGLLNGIAKPGQELIFSWSGAQPGDNNKIVGYSFGCTTKAEPPSETNKNLITEPEITDSFINWTTPETRGTTYYFFIKTRGEIDGYNAEWQQLSEACLVNRLPPKPDSTVNTVKIANAGGQVPFSLIIGEDDDPNQNLSLYYTINTDTEKILTTPNFSHNVKETTTFNFFTFDGLEYSENSTSVVVNVNNIPVIEKITDSSQQKSYTRTITVDASDDDDANLKYTYELWRGNSKLYSSTSNKSTHEIKDIRDFIDSVWSNETTFEWRVTVSDDLDNSEPKSISFNIFGCPSVAAIYNTHDFNYLQNSNPNHFSDQTRVKLNPPESFEGNLKDLYKGLRIKVNGINYPIDSTMRDISLYENQYYSDFSGLKANTQPGKNYTFEVYLVCLIDSNDSNDPKEKSWLISNNIQLTRAPQFSLSNLSANTISPFTLESIGEYSVVAFADNNKTKDELTTAYSLQESGFKYYWTINTVKGTTKDITVDFTSANATIILKQSGQNLFDSLPDATKIPWNRDYVGNQSQITVEVTNVFGDTVSASVNCPVYFVQSATSNKANPQLYIGTDDSSTKTWFNSGKHFLQENVHLYGDETFIIQDYFGCQSARLEINRNKQGWQHLNALTLTEIGAPYQLGTPVNCVLASNSLYQIKTITSEASYNCQFRIAFINQAGRTSYFNFTNNNSNQYLVLPHKPAVVSIESATYANNAVSFTAKVAYGFITDSPYGSRNLSCKAQFNNKEYTLVNQDIDLTTNLNKSFVFTDTNWSWKELQLEVTTNQILDLGNGNQVASTTTTNSNIVIVYNILPTVAYRLNHVGINTNNFSDNEIFVVGATSGRNMVKFTSASNNVTLDLADGKIVGITIDCGEWTEI